MPDDSGVLLQAALDARARTLRGDDEGWRPLSSAPRDGTVVEVRAQDQPALLMRWDAALANPLVSTRKGIWVSVGNTFTWCEDHGYGPEEWRPRARLVAGA